MTMYQLIELIRNTPSCIVYPPSTLLNVDGNQILPDDLREFYQLCGGLVLFDDSDYFVEIVRPESVVLANPVILPNAFQKPLITPLNDKEMLSWSWYVLCNWNNAEFIVIDFDQTRLGRCHYSWWESHAMEGHSPIIAWSFTEFLTRSLNVNGDQWYWAQPDFVSYGDAYDNI